MQTKIQDLIDDLSTSITALDIYQKEIPFSSEFTLGKIYAYRAIKHRLLKILEDDTSIKESLEELRR